MASGYTQEWSKTGRFTGKFRIYYSTSFNASTNRSTVTIRPQFWCSANYGNDYRIFSYGVSGAGVYVNGSCVYAFGSNYGSGNYLSCGSATESWANLDYSTSFEVAHDGNGDASFTVGIYGSVRAMYDGTTVSPIGGTASDRIYLHENAASSIASASASVATQGTFSLTMKRLASTNYHIATFKYNNSTVLYTSGRFDTSLSFTVPRSWFANYPDLAALPLTVSVQTYNSSGTAIGSPATKALTVNADADMKPVVSSGWVSLAPYNTGAIAGITGYVKGYSRAEATFDSSRIDMTAAVGASIASFSVTCQGETDSGAPYLTSVLSSASVPVVCTVTDTRGRTAGETFTLTVMDYAKPVLTGIAIFRCDEQGTEAEDGTRYSAKATLTSSSLDGQNVPALSSAVAASGGGYGAEEALTSGAAHISTAQLSADVTYTVRLTATDTLGNTAVYYQVLPTRKWAMKFRPTGNGVAFGKAAEHDNTFEITEDWTFLVNGKELGGVSSEDVVPISKGGTGADNAKDAVANLGVAAYVTEVSSSGNWSWVLYNDRTIDLYLNTRVIISNYSASTFGGLYEFGPFDLPFALEIGYTFLAGCKIGNGISIVALCNALSATRIDVVGQSNCSGTQSCDVYVHLHGRKAAT